MRFNQSVSEQEYEIPNEVTLMSVTDRESHITYANAAFSSVSGFNNEELLGQPHNMVRHPDMPKQAFGDMWATLKAGQAWSALVKNRRKDGKFYWVRANATPIMRKGRSIGYMSVRTKPKPSEITATEKLYQQFREGSAGKRKFHKGLVVRTGLMTWLSLFQTMSVAWRIRLSLLLTFAGSISALFMLGISGPLLAAITVLHLLLSTVSCLMLERGIAQPLQRVLKEAQSVAAGQPGENLYWNRIDEVGMLMRAINQSGLNLRSLVDDVGIQISGLSRISHEIAQGNTDISKHSEEAATSLEQTARSMERITVTIKSNADSASQANKLADSASEAAAQGGIVVNQVVDTMTAISTASKKIGDIISVIDGIAFQTNILALNAAVEAARAGEQGRGFAVVANEVRMLAHRSAAAAKEIKDLITSNMATVTLGGKLVDDAGKAMSNIVSQVDRVATLIGEISAATSQQSEGLSQVNTAVNQLDAMTQQNFTLIEQSLAAAENLKTRADKLTQAVEVFAFDASAFDDKNFDMAMIDSQLFDTTNVDTQVFTAKNLNYKNAATKDFERTNLLQGQIAIAP